MVIGMKEFFGNIKQEWNKMTWPTDKEMKLHSVQVFVFMLILTLFFAAVDGVISIGISTPTKTEDAYELDYDYDEYDLDELLDYEDDGSEDGDED
jgi:preprotein translocase subunit SecE